MKEDRIYLVHIRDAIDRVLEYTVEGRESFFEDRKTQDAVLRNLEVIGEAVKHLSDTLKRDDSGIQWKQIAGMRDKLIHEYFGVDIQLVWDVVGNELPPFRSQVEIILARLKA